METLVFYLPALGCGAMMLLICIPMMRNMHKRHDDPADSDTRQKIAELREEISRLRAENTLDSGEKRTSG